MNHGQIFKILTIVGARPQFIKAAMVTRAIFNHNKSKKKPEVVEEIVHTGQYYDRAMSQILFKEMDLPEPAVNLNVNNAGHGEMTGAMLIEIEKETLGRKPYWVLDYGGAT